MARSAALLPLLLFFLSATLVLSDNHSHRRFGGSEYPESEQAEQGRDNPFVFRDNEFKTALETGEGRLRVLDRFPERRPELFRGIENYRVVTFEANPRTMLVPSHYDAELLIYVIEGSATITFLRNGETDSYNISRGDVVRVRAGRSFYILNTDDNKKFRTVQLFETVSVPGRFEPFIGVGGQNPQSYLLEFSKETLQASYKTPFELVKKVVGASQGFIKNVSDQQRVREIAQEASSSHGRRYPFGVRYSNAPLSMFSQKPIFSNQHGHLLQLDAGDFEQLRDLDVSVTQALIRAGSLQVPHFYTRAFKMAVVISGKGKYELVSPHLQDRSRPQQSVSYKRFSGQISEGDLILIPTATPFVFRADQGQDLHIFCFDINGRNNLIQLLAGRDAVMSGLSDAEKEVIFKCPKEEVDRVMNSQPDNLFVEVTQGQQQERGEGGREVQ